MLEATSLQDSEMYSVVTGDRNILNPKALKKLWGKERSRRK